MLTARTNDLTIDQQSLNINLTLHQRIPNKTLATQEHKHKFRKQ